MWFHLVTCSHVLLVLLAVPAAARAAENAEAPVVGEATRAAEIDWQALRDIGGQPLPLSGRRWTVVCFLGTECPLARLYGPRLQRLQEEFAPHGVRFVGVNSNWQDSPAEIRKYADDLQLSLPIVKDVRQVLARKLGATRTPEVFVLDETDRIRYQGRIDDQYEPGVARAEPARHELRDALQALVAGRQVPVARTQAAGCLITRLDRAPAAGARQADTPNADETQTGNSPAAVTFTRDVAPILQQHCVECHRPGEIGPFALTDYDQVVGWAEMILEVVEQNRMPPWHADPRYGKFVGARQLPAKARAMLA
ncbi:MAG: redoxin domain-containing protein, partial [Pirellulaceae bacterium]|nr:redoxin domain-containing protein [Pirellulaceae bacterium]